MENLRNDEQPIDQGLLVEAFETFSKTSAALEKSYLELQEKVSDLNLELEQKNETLAENLHETERISAHLTAILSSMRDGVLAFDLDEKVTMVNQSASAFFDTSTDKIVGRSVREVLVGTLGYLPPILSEDRDCGPKECHIHRGEEHLVYSVDHHPLLDNQKNKIGGLVTLEDITFTEFARQQSERNERLAAMGKMAVNIVHEIRNPMGSIELMASLLRRDLADDPPKMDLAGRISAGIRSLNHIIENLLMFSRDRDPAKSFSDITQIIDEALDMVDPMLRRNNVLVSKNFDENTKGVVCDQELFKQALSNIFINAGQAMPDGGELRLATNRRDLNNFSNGQPSSFIQLRIADTGTGISSETKSRIFDPFFTTKERGTGLGLALVHKIVRSHGGFIGVDSTPGQGTIFTLMIPIQSQPEQSNG